MPSTSPHWSTQQLTELIAAVAELPDPTTVIRRAVEHVAEALDSEIAALVADGQVVHSLGFPAGAWPVAALVEAAGGGHTVLEVEGVGPCALATADCEAISGARLVVGRGSEDPFTQVERALLRGMAQVLSLALQARRLLDEERTSREISDAHAADNAQLLASLQERQTLLERLARIQRSISSRKPLDEVLDAIVVGAAELLGEDIVGLRLLDPADPSYMVMTAWLGVPDHLAAATARQPVEQGIGGRAIVENSLVHTSSYPTVDQPLPGFAADGIQSAMAAPVRQGTRAVGSLVVATRRPSRTYSASEQEALTAFAEHVSLALNDAQSVEALHRAVAEATHQSRHDSLTGLPNRLLFNDRLEQAITRSHRDRTQFALLYLDLDRFKPVNDTLGHAAGDELLKALSPRIRREIRESDTVARIGGDEFAVILNDAGRTEAAAVAAKIATALATPFQLGAGNQRVGIGASIGIAIYPQDALTADALVLAADAAMYVAKQAA